MESLTQVIEKRDTFNDLLKLIPKIPDKYVDRIASARALWNAMSIDRQRQIYYTIREQLKRRESVNPNPYFLIDDCHPRPTNYNGKDGINQMMKNEKMVIAKYDGVYGTYTALEAKIFCMTDVSPLN